MLMMLFEFVSLLARTHADQVQANAPRTDRLFLITLVSLTTKFNPRKLVESYIPFSFADGRNHKPDLRERLACLMLVWLGMRCCRRRGDPAGDEHQESPVALLESRG